MAKVRALTRGYVGGVIREGGEVFDWPEGLKLGSWVKPVSDADDVADEPETVDEAPAKKARKGKKGSEPETVDAPTAEPFADAPEPVRVANEINDQTGGTAPDWVSPTPAD